MYTCTEVELVPPSGAVYRNYVYFELARVRWHPRHLSDALVNFVDYYCELIAIDGT
jgi:hypothetical protein